MKKIVLSTILSLMAVASFAQVTEPTEKHKVNPERKAAWESCRASVSVNEDKKEHREAVKKCMESKGFSGHEHESVK